MLGMAQSEAPVKDLVRAYALSLEALTARGVIRSHKVLADYAEWLATEALRLTLVPGGSQKGYDAVDPRNGLTYQVKARRLAPPYFQPDLRGFGDLDERPFDFLVGILVDADYAVVSAAVVPLAVVRQRAKGTRLYMGRGLLSAADVRDVTAKVRRVSES